MVENIAKGWRAVDSLVAAGACICGGYGGWVIQERQKMEVGIKRKEKG